MNIILYIFIYNLHFCKDSLHNWKFICTFANVISDLLC